jgi:hypothetical protein
MLTFVTWMVGCLVAKPIPDADPVSTCVRDLTTTFATPF